MLTLFTNITQQLTETERETLVPLLLQILKQSHEDNTIHSHQLCILFKAQGHNMSGVRIRKMINYIRVANLAKPAVVIGSSNGYFITTSPAVIEKQIESTQGRIDAMNAYLDTMKAQLHSLKTNPCNASS